MRVQVLGSPDMVYYLHGDHLGSASLTTNDTGGRVGELRYKPYGETRYVWGTTPTDRRFTGQLEESGLGSLYDYGARRYSPLLGRFLSADTIVPSPGNPQSLNRYAYGYNNPLKYVDPTGHIGIPGIEGLAQLLQTIATNFGKANDAYNAGERRNGVLALHATGGTGLLVSQAEAVNQLNQDTSVVFSQAPLEERLPHCVHLGGWATETAATVVGIGQLAKVGIASLEKPKIGWTGKIGEDALKKLGGESQVYFKTNQGGRYVDQLVNGIAHESKVGYTTLTKSIQRQIAKDVELMATGDIKGSVWHFFKSPATGLGGPSDPLAKALTKAGIQIAK